MSISRLPMALAIVLAIPTHGQELVQDPGTREVVNSLGQTITAARAVRFLVTPPLREWPTVDGNDANARREVENERRTNPVAHPEALAQGPDPARQQRPPTHPSRSPLVNFAGQNGNSFPPDPTGAAGLDDFVQAVNTSFKVYSKTGLSLSGSMSLSNLWSGSSNEGDPIVLYDRHADRWFISQFQSGPDRILIAISQTGDPTGSYYAYAFNFSQFPDYPKFSVWWDGYYMTSNSNKTAIVFEREKMLAGDPTAQMVALSAPSASNAGFRSVLPADADGDLPPNGTPCYFFNLEDNAWGGVSQDRIKVYAMTTDWNTISNTAITLQQTLNTQAFDTNFGSGFSNIAQPNTTQKLDAVAEILYFRAPHYRFVDHSSVVLCHVVDVDGSDHAGIRWYELRDNNDGNFYIHQQGTYAPDDGHRWMASIAMDHEGNIGLGYSYSDPSTMTYPSLRYTGRYSGDPLGEMTVAETTAMNGNGSQSGVNRYGDYAQMSLDPDGTTFWFTGEYLTTGGSIRTRIFSFDLASSVGVDAQARSTFPVLEAHLENGAIIVHLDQAPSGPFQYDLIDLLGRTVHHEEVNVHGTTWSTTTPIAGLSGSVYFVRTGNAGFQRVRRIPIDR